MAVVYLIHFQRPLYHARHYLGYTVDLEERIKKHASGSGARLIRAINAIGIPWEVSQTWECKDWREAKELERNLKAQKNAPRLCPICQQETGE